MSASFLDAEELFKEKISCTKIYTPRFLEVPENSHSEKKTLSRGRLQ